MLLQRSLRIFTLIVLLTPFYASPSEQKPEDQNPSIEQKPTEQVVVNPPIKITTHYSLKQVWRPAVWTALGGLFFASLPAIAASLMQRAPLKKDQHISKDEYILRGGELPIMPEDILALSALSGAMVGWSIAWNHDDLVKNCSICAKPENKELGWKDLANRLLTFYAFTVTGGACGAGLAAITQQFYPKKFPTTIDKYKIIKALGVFGASLGFIEGVNGMKEHICSDCENEKLLKQM